MKYQKKNFIDNMVDVFGYDYVIGFCLCSEYDIRGKAKKESDATKSAKLNKIANMYAQKAEQLINERIVDEQL